MRTLNHNNQRTVRNLIIFTIMVIILGWFGLWLDSLLGNPLSRGFGLLFWLITPLTTSLLLRALAGDGWKDFGLKPAIKGNGVWYLTSILVHPICITLILGVGFVLNAVSFSAPLGIFVRAVAFALPGFFIKNIFVEEFAWRGYLAPKMYSLGLNVFVAHTLVGLIWGVWHLPYYLAIDPLFVQGYTPLSLATYIPLSIIVQIPLSILYGELRIQTGSVWPAVLIHTMLNAINQPLLLEGFIEIPSRLQFLVITLSMLLYTLIGVGIHLWSRKRKEF